MDLTIKDFFEKHVLPLHLKVKNQEIEYLNEEYGTSEDSYFSHPVFPEYQRLSHIPLENEAELTSYLKAFWKDDVALLSLVPDLVRLAFALKGENKELSSELSSLLYVMY